MQGNESEKNSPKMQGNESEKNSPKMQGNERSEGRYQSYRASSSYFYYSLEFARFRKNSLLKFGHKLNKRLQNETLILTERKHTPLGHVVTQGTFKWFINGHRYKDTFSTLLQKDSSKITAEQSAHMFKTFYKDVDVLRRFPYFFTARLINVHNPGTIYKTVTDVNFRDVTKLCNREEEFITKRKQIVIANIKRQYSIEKILMKKEDAPTIAIIGSGGGLRAMIGMCGAMTALKKTRILDSTMYTAGVSGSSWYITAMFANDKQDNPEELNDIFRQKLQTFSRRQFLGILLGWMNMSHIAKFLEVRNFYSISDSFGDMIGGLLLKKEHRCHSWSDQTTKLQDGKCPLPIISALHVRDEKTIKDYNEWIEFSPYEVFMPKYGAAIDMKDFGNEFYGGYITEKYGETSIPCLQGICGSGFAKARNFKPSDEHWYMTLSGIKDRIGVLFSTFDNIFVGKVSNWLLGIEIEPLFDDFRDTDKTCDKKDVENEKMMLVDAGIAFNSPYPPVLHPSRKIDIIISFDFTQRNNDDDCPFRELEKAEKWANERRIPFPELNLQKKKIDWKNKKYEEVYVFQGANAPTIVHFVLINKLCFIPGRKDNGKSKHVFKIFPNYRTKRFTYSATEIDRLMLLVQSIVFKNIKKIDDCIIQTFIQKFNDRITAEKHNKPGE